MVLPRTCPHTRVVGYESRYPDLDLCQDLLTSACRVYNCLQLSTTVYNCLHPSTTVQAGGWPAYCHRRVRRLSLPVLLQAGPAATDPLCQRLHILPAVWGLWFRD